MIRFFSTSRLPRQVRFRAEGLAMPLALSGLACSVQTETFDVDGESGSVHALIQVRRVEMYDGQPHGDALAAFVRIPPSTDAEHLLKLTGLSPQFPEAGQCDMDRPDFNAGEQDGGRAELLSANAVELQTHSGQHSLAPHAFPSAYDLLRGVVYSSRDQLADDLPENADYLLAGYGIETGAAQGSTELRSHQPSPAFPAGVRLLDQAFEHIDSISLQPVLDFVWQGSSDPRDSIVITIATADSVYRCGFHDQDGFGSVPLVSASGETVWRDETSATVAVHRIRSTFDSHPDLSQVAVAFDFSVEKSWFMSSRPKAVDDENANED